VLNSVLKYAGLNRIQQNGSTFLDALRDRLPREGSSGDERIERSPESLTVHEVDHKLSEMQRIQWIIFGIGCIDGAAVEHVVPSTEEIYQILDADLVIGISGESDLDGVGALENSLHLLLLSFGRRQMLTYSL
jgi:hypothetical protein